MKSTQENCKKNSEIVELTISLDKDSLKRSLIHRRLVSKEAEPEENTEDQGQSVITKTCKNCTKSCKIKVHKDLYENSSVNCIDYKAKPIKLTF